MASSFNPRQTSFIAFTLATLLLVAPPWAIGATAQQAGSALGDPNGPGQEVSMPPPQCARTIACQYAERSFLPDGYRMQSLQVCGANCTTQYWVSARTDGQQLLEIPPVRGGGVLATGRPTPDDHHPPVRSVLPYYAATDPACCPSGFVDTISYWDATTDTLVGGDPTLTPASDFPGWDAVRQELVAEGWILAGV